MTAATKYTFGDAGGSNNAVVNKGGRMKHRQMHRRKPSEDDASEGNGSLTYSAASSINSAGESTDSSFADIMRVLDLQDNNSAAMAAIMHEKKHQKQANHYPSGHPKSSSRSIASMTPSTASSLQYSTDSQSHMLAGADIISTITGQPSDSYAYDYGNLGGNPPNTNSPNIISSNQAGTNINNNRKATSSKTNSNEPDIFGEQNIMFAPAEPAESIKRRKQMKRKSNSGKDKDAASTSSAGTRTSKSKSRDPNHRSSSRSSSRSSRDKSSPSTPSGSDSHHNNYSTPSMQKMYSQGTPTTSTPGSSGSGTSSTNSTPPPIPPAFYPLDDDDVCYAKWWMSCFPDAFKNLMPKR